MDFAFNMKLPEHFINTIQGTFGEKGRLWLQQLPALIQACAVRYELQVQTAVSNLSYNYVAPATRADGTEVMLKIGVPHRELLTEMASLQLCQGQGAVKLLASDAELGVLVLERLQPGRSLVGMFPDDDEEATRIAAAVMRRFWQPVPKDPIFPTIYDWSFGLQRLRNEFDGGVGPFPRKLVEQAESLFAELLPSIDDVVLLHGDLHHDNILAAEREPWLVIDPKGVIGEPAYEVGAWLRNPVPGIFTHPDLRELTGRRIAILSEMLDLDRQRLMGWGMAQAVLSGWWSYEDEGYGWEDVLVCADVLAELMKGE